mmetsp:Transcript_2484/g.5433  ORF Transcript_2484/g.5433 Transcript_2484/m.5433 type:complete len:353 (+) Transcript_2484:22-1080(+)
MEVIDYKKLLREERERLKNKNNNPSDEKQKEEEEKDEIADRGRKKHGKKTDTAVSYNNCNWDYEDGFLGFRKLSLRSICEDPRSISYSSTALGQHQPLLQAKAKEIDRDNTNKNESISPEVALKSWLQRIPSGDSGLGEWKTMAYAKRRVCMFGEEEKVANIKSSQPLPPPLEEIARELVKQNIFPSSSPPNHVLLNEYQPGQGILPHTDGPLYHDRTATLSLNSDVVIKFTKRLSSNEIGRTKTTSTVNSASNNHNETKGGDNNHQMDEQEHNTNKSINFIYDHSMTVLLESGSLLVFQGEAYMNYCHGIEMDAWQDVTTDKCLNAPSGQVVPRSLRYSLTFRHKKAKEDQ